MVNATSTTGYVALAVGWALVGQLFAMLESGAEIVGPALWVPWGILAAIVRRDFPMSRSAGLPGVPAGLFPSHA